MKPASPRRRVSGRALENHQLALDRAGDSRFALAHEHIDFRAYAEVRQVNAGLDREATPRSNAPLVVRFEIVHVGAIAVDVLSDGVPGAMHEVLAEPARLNEAPRRVIDFETTQRLAGRDGG